MLEQIAFAFFESLLLLRLLKGCGLSQQLLAETESMDERFKKREVRSSRLTSSQLPTKHANQACPVDPKQ